MANAKTGRSVGQPTKYKPEYCAKLIEHMASGLGYLSFAGVIRVHQSIMYDWEKEHGEWADAKNIGQSCKLLHDEKLLLSGIKGEIEGFSAGAMVFTMKAQHGWKDRLEVSGHVVNESYEQYLARIKGEQSDVIETSGTLLLGEDHQD
jgi:hypothetical protein